MAKKLCCERNCYSVAVDRGRCEEHKREPFYGNYRRERLPKDWAHRRRIILSRYDSVCHICGEPGADSVDHLESGDDHSLENLRPAHQNVPPYCHRSKTAQEGAQARWEGNNIKDENLPF